MLFEDFKELLLGFTGIRSERWSCHLPFSRSGRIRRDLHMAATSDRVGNFEVREEIWGAASEKLGQKKEQGLVWTQQLGTADERPPTSPVSKWRGVKQNCMGGLRCSYIRRQLHATAKWYYYHDHQGMPTKKLMTFRSPAPLNPLKHTKTRCYPLDSGRNLVRMPLSFSPHIRLLYWPVPMSRWNTSWSQMKMAQILVMQNQWAG